MTDSSKVRSEGQTGSLIISALFVFAGIVTLYDTTGYTDRDSQVFPQAVAIILIITAALSFVMRFLNPTEDDGFGRGVWWRRIILIATMLLTCFAMPYIGFLAAGVIAFGGGLIAAMHDKWSKKTMFLYSGSGVIILVSFFAVFKYVLLVPLP